MRIGIREDRVSSHRRIQNRSIIARTAGYEVIEGVLKKPPIMRWDRYLKESELPVSSVCMDFWQNYDWISTIEDISNPIEIELSSPYYIMLPCFGKSALGSSKRIEQLIQLLKGSRHKGKVIIEANNSPEVMKRICKETGSLLCYDTGNERSMNRGSLGDIDTLFPFIHEVHFKYREFKSFTTVEFPEDKTTVLWYRKRIQKLLNKGFDGDIILETPKGNLERNMEIVRACL